MRLVKRVPKCLAVLGGLRHPQQSRNLAARELGGRRRRGINRMRLESGTFLKRKAGMVDGDKETHQTWKKTDCAIFLHSSNPFDVWTSLIALAIFTTGSS